MIKIGTADLVDRKVGTTQVQKVMSGTTEIWSKGGVCIPLEGDAAIFLTAPSSHTRDGVVLEIVEASNPDDVWPDGPKPFIAGHNMSTGTMAAAKAAGYTVAGSYGGVHHNVSIQTTAASHGLKSIFPIREWSIGTSCEPLVAYAGMHKNERPSNCSSEDMPNPQQSLNDAIHTYMDLVLDDPVANANVVAWGFYGDDWLTNPDGRDGYSRAEIRAGARYCYELIIAYDNPAGGHPNGKQRPISDYPWTPEYESVNYYDGVNLRELTGIWTDQNYAWYGPIISFPQSFRCRGNLSQYTDRKVRINAIEPPIASGKNRTIAPMLWGQGDEAHIPSQRLEPYQKRAMQCNALIHMMSGGHGFFQYQYLASHAGVTHLDWWNEAIGNLTSNSVIDALLWGVEKSDISRANVTGTLGGYQTIGKNDLSGGSTMSHSNQEMILVKNVQYKNARYLVVTNMSIPQETWQYLDDNFNYSFNPQPDAWEMIVDFTVPSNMVGIKCTEIISGANEDITDNKIRVSLIGVESAVYKFEVADGFCGGDKPQDPPVISNHPQSVSVSAPDPVAFSVTYSPASALVQWQWHPLPFTDDTWLDISGETASVYSKSSTVVEMNGETYRAIVTTSGNAPAYSNPATLTVT